MQQPKPDSSDSGGDSSGEDERTTNNNKNEEENCHGDSGGSTTTSTLDLRAATALGLLFLAVALFIAYSDNGGGGGGDGNISSSPSTPTPIPLTTLPPGLLFVSTSNSDEDGSSPLLTRPYVEEERHPSGPSVRGLPPPGDEAEAALAEWPPGHMGLGMEVNEEALEEEEKERKEQMYKRHAFQARHV